MNIKLILIFIIIFLTLISCDINKNTGPSASFVVTPTIGTIETIFSVDASGCTDKEDDASDLEVRWDWEDDSIWDTEWSTVKTATHSYNSMNAYEIKLEVKDSDGLTDITYNSVELGNTPPTASFTITPNNGPTSTIFTFDASGCTDMEDDTSDLQVRWDWHNDGDWDDGFNTSKLITHQFNLVKNHTVLLEVMDSGGLTDTLSMILDVSVGCGANIVNDIILTEDINCTSYDYEALIISTSNVTVDLGGKTIRNNSQNREKKGLAVHNAENVSIKNGNIEGFLFGIDVRNSTNITIENINIYNMKIAHPDTFVFGISSTNSQNVNIINCQFGFPKAHHKTAVIVYQSNIIVDNILMEGGGVGVGFSFVNTGYPGSIDHNNGGTVKNCTIIDAHTAGVWIGCSNNLLIQNNEFIRNEIAVQAYGPAFGSIKNISIEDNYIHDGFQGIHFMGINESLINNNIINQNVYQGIMMNQSHDCAIGITTENCFYSTDNTISNNIVTENGTDLEHYELAVGNNWVNNTCQTKEGAEIPDCTD